MEITKCEITSKSFKRHLEVSKITAQGVAKNNRVPETYFLMHNWQKILSRQVIRTCTISLESKD